MVHGYSGIMIMIKNKMNESVQIKSVQTLLFVKRVVNYKELW